MKYRRIGVLTGVLVTTVALAAGAAGYRRAHPGRTAAATAATAAAAAGRRPAATPAGGKTIRELAAGDDQTCALYTHGSVVCWGAARYDAPLGTADESPHRLAGVTGAVAVSVGDTHGCVLDGDGVVSCWGYCDPACRAGTGPLLFAKPTRVADVPRLSTIVADALGDTTCGVGAEDEELHCWGSMSASVTWFGDPVGPRLYHYGPELGGKGRFARGAHAGAVELMTSSMGASCARFPGGLARCWSDGMTDGEGKPHASLEAPREPVARMAGGFLQGCFVLVSGKVECHSTDGILRPPFAELVTTAAAAGNAICATGRSGSLLCVRYAFEPRGDGNVARLQRGATFEARARDVGGPARAVVSGTHHFCVLREDDAVYCWDEYGVADPVRVALPAAD